MNRSRQREGAQQTNAAGANHEHNPAPSLIHAILHAMIRDTSRKTQSLGQEAEMGARQTKGQRQLRHRA